MPLRALSRERWKRTDRAFRLGLELPPVILYKLDGAYFVKDGQHRASVARFHGAKWIGPDVTEFRSPTDRTTAPVPEHRPPSTASLAARSHSSSIRIRWRRSWEIPRIKPAVEELLQYTSPVEIASERYAREEMEISGTKVSRGGLILGVLGSANRDERHFENPEVLDLARDPNRHLALGRGGVHHCLGAPLARMEGQIAISALLRRFPDPYLAVPSGSLRWRRGLFLRGLERLPLVV